MAQEGALEVLRVLISLLDVEQTASATVADVVDALPQVVDGCAVASVSALVDSVPVSLASTDRSRSTRLEQAELRAGRGPGLCAIEELQPVLVRSGDGDDRFPEASAAAEEQRLASTYAVPLHLRDRRLGVLMLHCGGPDAFSEAALAAAQLVGLHLSGVMAVLAERDLVRSEVDQLRDALIGRDVIGQAKGILMASRRLSAEAAFEILRQSSQAGNVKLRTLAEQVASIGELPGPDDGSKVVV